MPRLWEGRREGRAPAVGGKEGGTCPGCGREGGRDVPRLWEGRREGHAPSCGREGGRAVGGKEGGLWEGRREGHAPAVGGKEGGLWEGRRNGGRVQQLTEREGSHWNSKESYNRNSGFK